jgi:hypothetical protein
VGRPASEASFLRRIEKDDQPTITQGSGVCSTTWQPRPMEIVLLTKLNAAAKKAELDAASSRLNLVLLSLKNTIMEQWNWLATSLMRLSKRSSAYRLVILFL